MRFRWRDRGEVIVSVHYYQIFGFTIRKSLSVELKLLIKIISSFDNNRKCYTLNWHQILSYDSYSSTLWFILFFFFLSMALIIGTKIFLSMLLFTWRCMCLYASVWISLYKYTVKHRGRRIVEFLRFPFYESSDKKNWILETAT